MFRLRGSHALRRPFPEASPTLGFSQNSLSQSCNPALGGLGSSPFARRYLGNLF